MSYSPILDRLPATAPEIAAIEGKTVRHVNAILQFHAARGSCKRTDKLVKPPEKRRGRRAGIWIRLSAAAQSQEIAT